MIRAIYFDAVGTLIHPRPSAAEVYHAAGRRRGSWRSQATVARRFQKAFQKQETLDRSRGWTTSELRERLRWRDIVADVLGDVRDPEDCFEELYEHFAKPQAWQCESGVDKLLKDLARRGFTLGMASNYDHRLRSVVAGLRPVRAIKNLLISAEIGWRKPAPEFFAALCRQADAKAPEILYVGDDRANDYGGARLAGLQAVLLERRPRKGRSQPGVIHALDELSVMLRRDSAEK